jgi:hypothetical protein
MATAFQRGFCLAVIAALSSLPALGQLEVTGETKLRLNDASGMTKIGNTIFIDGSTSLSSSVVALITVETEAANVDLSVSDSARVPGEAIKIAAGRYVIDKPGKWWVDVTAIDFAKNIYGRKSVVVEVGPAPAPTPPTPGPGPTPTPPIDGIGFRVLILSESSERHTLTAEQRNILFGQKTRDYLNDNAVKGDDGKTPEWRILDPDTPFTEANNRFAKAMKRPRTSPHWIIVSNGTTGYEGPLPATVEDFLLLLDKYVPPRGLSASVGSTSIEVMMTPNCVWCDRWKYYELGLLSMPVTFLTGGAKAYPSFVIRHNGRESRLEGYHDAKQIKAEIARLGGSS